MVRASFSRRSAPMIVEAALLVALAACEGGPAPSTDGRPLGVPFEGAFRLVRAVPLEERPENPIVDPIALAIWNGELVIVDQLASDLKVFDAAGRLLRVIGRPGKGPGEFRLPRAATAVAGNRLAVLDAQGVSLFHPPDRFDRRWPAASLGGQNFAPVLGGTRLALGALAEPGQPRVRVYDLDGRLTGSFMPAARIRHLFERNFSVLGLASASDRLVAADRASSRVFVHDLASGREAWIDLGVPPYEPPAWKELSPDASMQAVAEWANRQMWVLQPVAVDSCRILVPFSRYDPIRDEPRIHYVLVEVCARRSGRFIVIGPTASRFLAAEGDRFYAVTTRENGSHELSVYRLAVHPAESRSGPRDHR
ncbi:MAG TPA: 6-bladed beta-propeller [Gemmatimonadales bacterium]|nr:6-bladed beta-propeller [Gemmatimonadales bacterium]